MKNLSKYIVGMLLVAYLIIPFKVHAEGTISLEILKVEKDSLEDICKRNDRQLKILSDSIALIRKSIEDRKGDFQCKYINRLGHVKSKRKTAEMWRDSMKKLEGRIAKCDEQLAAYKSAEDNNTYLKDFEVEFINPKLEYIKQSYTVITDDEIEKILEECKSHDNVKSVKSLKSKIDGVKLSRQDYYELLTLLDIKYNAVRIKEARSQIRIKISSNISSLQKQDWQKLNSLLNAYPEGLKEMKAIIEDDNRAFFDFRDLELDVDLKINVEKSLSLPERKHRLETYIYPIPYLKKKYNEYEEWLKKDAMKRNTEIEQEFNVEQ